VSSELEGNKDGDGVYCGPIDIQGLILNVDLGVARSCFQGEVLQEAVGDVDLPSHLVIKIELLSQEAIPAGKCPVNTGSEPKGSLEWEISFGP
jgi:hypothetical protein